MNLFLGQHAGVSMENTAALQVKINLQSHFFIHFTKGFLSLILTTGFMTV